MQIAPLTRIDCVLLHETEQDLPESDLKACVTAVLTAAGLTPAEQPAESAGEGRTLVFHAGNWRLRVHSAPSPLARETLNNVLPLPYTRTIFPDAEQVVQAHAAHTWLSLEKAIDGQQNQTAPFTDSREAMPAMSLVALLAREIMARRPMAAVYWGPSDHLLPPSLFRTFTSDSRLILLNIRPQYFAGNSASGQTQAVGMIAWGTQHLIGRLLVFEPATIAPGDLHGLAAGTASTILQKERVPRPGERFSVPGLPWQAVVQSGTQSFNGTVEVLRLLPVSASAGLETEGASVFGSAPGAATAFDPHGQNNDAAGPDPDLTVLPPEVREEILEQRRRRGHVDSGIDSGAFRTTAMNAVAGFLALFLVANFFIGRFSGLDEPPRKQPTSRVEAAAPAPIGAKRPARTTRLGGEERSERLATISERLRDGEDAAYDERPRDEEREVMEADRPEDEEKELKDQPDTVPEGEIKMATPGNGEDEYSADMDEGRETEDLVRD